MPLDKSLKILSDLIVFSKYAKHKPEYDRRETWDEICDRIESMFTNRFPTLKSDIKSAMKQMRSKKIVSSMRVTQFAGKAIEMNEMRGYNCSYTSIEKYQDFSEVFFLSLGGTGVGYSVQKHHIDKLPPITKPGKSRKFLIGDSIIGWSDAVKILIKSYLKGSFFPLFDYSDIRPEGTPLKTAGGKAPGPEPLKRCLNKIEALLSRKKEGEKLTPLECHDIICYIADATVSGGIRRSACICLFDFDDEEMLNCKGNFPVEIWNGGFHLNPQTKTYDGEVKYKDKIHPISLWSEEAFNLFMETKKLPWYYFEPQRARSNNSAVLFRPDFEKEGSKERFLKFWKRIEDSGCGEPGFFWTNDLDYGTNPCSEISLRSKELCNLTEVNLSDVQTQEELESRIWAATLLGTIQASYTDFHFVDSKWIKTCEEDALLGVSFTGIADNDYEKFDWESCSKVALETNEKYAQILGINKSARLGTVKPSGTVSALLGTASGIHARFSPYYIRRIRFNKSEAIAQYLIINHPELVENEIGNPLNIVVSIPIKSPEKSRFRTESPLETLERVKFFHENWIKPTHRHGENTHNVSCTINLKNEDWYDAGEWCWNNRESYVAISVLPHDGGNYLQAPFEEVSEEVFNEKFQSLKNVDLTKVIEMYDYTDLKSEAACAGGSCEII